MKKTYRLENLDCAACAAKMEAAISKLDGVESVSVNFIMQKLTLEAKKAVKLCRRVEPDMEIIF